MEVWLAVIVLLYGDGQTDRLTWRSVSATLVCESTWNCLVPIPKLHFRQENFHMQSDVLPIATGVCTSAPSHHNRCVHKCTVHITTGVCTSAPFTSVCNCEFMRIGRTARKHIIRLMKNKNGSGFGHIVHCYCLSSLIQRLIGHGVIVEFWPTQIV
jgi:hypothetical protein